MSKFKKYLKTKAGIHTASSSLPQSDILNKDSLILVFILGSNSANSQYNDISMAASKVTKATTDAATNGSSTNQAGNQSQSDPTSCTGATISARYDRRH